MLSEHAGEVTAPVAAGPPKTLLEKFGVVLQRRLQFGALTVLDARLPSVRQHPSCHEIVVISIQLILLTPIFVREAVGKGGILQDVRSICDGPARETGDAAVQVGRGRDLKVPPFQIECAEKVPQIRFLGAAEPLTRPYATDIRPFKAGQHPLKDGGGPGHIVVSKDCDLGLHLGDGLAHLTALVGMRHAEGTHSRAGHGADQFREALVAGIDRDQEDLKGLRGETASDRLPQTVAVAFERRDDDGDIARVERGLGGKRDGEECPMCEAIDY